MIHREQFPDGGWADLRDPADIPERLRRPIRRIQMRLAKDPAFAGVIEEAQSKGVEAVQAAVAGADEAEALRLAASIGDDAMDLIDDLNDRAVIARVVGWSYGPEVSMEVLQDLPGPLYDRLRELCADGVLAAGGADFDPSPDPASPTVPSTA